ncbi:M48 family metallopeptidase [Glaciimonas immobilis]|uniref:Membrane-associated protease RseP (Regulator of RpoE activity) n=1 Tax=Glaciimonas immobilis TaxID=728004 RepID=A0A840S0A7_9BURK|nr:M48 family metallopeptidase [Glaciimonas immobilis]KAF3998472.1 M48 family metalloprotease [Glaciimonas immobilis]MBB5202029.1 membrane-associated protease RseP (regulator of RpoE activity) [Glaciimonas immobilis]
MKAINSRRWFYVKRYAATLPVLLLAACATQEPEMPAPIAKAPSAGKAYIAPRPVKAPTNPQESELRAIVTQQDRLYNVAAPLLVSNADLCRNNARNLLGFTAKTKFSYSTEFIEAAQTSLGLSDQLQVTGVLAGSGAAQAGVKPGDLLSTIQGKPVTTGPNAERLAALMLGPLVNRNVAIDLGLVRKGNNVDLKVLLTRACAFGIELGNTENVNSFADGRRVLVTSGMVKFAKTDDELAYVIAREMAHNSLMHVVRQRMTATMSGIIDNLIRVRPDTSSLSGGEGVKPYTQQLDLAADKLALYMVARAGYKIDTAAAFWQRLATQYPVNVTNGHTAIHPSTSARMDLIQKTIAEINAKQAIGGNLMP